MSPPPAGRPPGPTGSGVRRIAEVQLRGPGGPLAARAYWPAPPDPVTAPALLVLLPGGDPDDVDAVDAFDGLCRGACADIGVVVLSPTPRAGAPDAHGGALEDALAAVHWAADHAAELGADPGRLLLAGMGVGGRAAAAVARQAQEDGWPAVTHQVSIEPGTAERMRLALARSLRPALGAG
jgi:acetyl esterase